MRAELGGKLEVLVEGVFFFWGGGEERGPEGRPAPGPGFSSSGPALISPRDDHTQIARLDKTHDVYQSVDYSLRRVNQCESLHLLL